MIHVLRVLILLSCIGGSYYMGFSAFGIEPFSVWGLVIGITLAALAILLDLFFKKATVRNILSIFVGIVLGLVLSRLFISVVNMSSLSQTTVQQLSYLSAILFSYLGAIVILRGQEEFQVLIPFVRLDTKNTGKEIIILDTSVIIDGRILGMAETEFVSGTMVVPRFVLKELQQIADSADDLKRAKGRRGLDILNQIKTSSRINVKIQDMEYPEIPTVDSKLVKMAQELNAKIWTNDFNLNKVAEIQGVHVLNINDLANALKPAAISGERMTVKVVKQGKEADQGVSYLEDGTMIVVEEGSGLVGKTIDIEILSVLQTQAGRMIFAKPLMNKHEKR